MFDSVIPHTKWGSTASTVDPVTLSEHRCREQKSREITVNHIDILLDAANNRMDLMLELSYCLASKHYHVRIITAYPQPWF
jgi:hypothetical protein